MFWHINCHISLQHIFIFKLKFAALDHIFLEVEMKSNLNRVINVSAISLLLLAGGCSTKRGELHSISLDDDYVGNRLRTTSSTSQFEQPQISIQTLADEADRLVDDMSFF